MYENNEERKDDLFLKVSIENIKNGEVSRIGLQRYGLLVVLASFSNNQGKCFPSQDTLAELCGLGRKRINAMIKELCDYRTEDDKAILEKVTKRKGETKTQSEYQFLASSGMAFGTNKVVSNKGQRQEGGDIVKDSSGVVSDSSKRLSRIRPEGCVVSGTLTKALEQNPLTKTKEQEGEIESVSTEKKKDSFKDNNTSKFVDTEKESKEAKRISSSIVAKGRSKSDIDEDQATGANTGGTASQERTEGDSLSEATTPQELATEAVQSQAEKERQFLLERSAEAEKGRELQRKKYIEDQRRQSRAWGGGTDSNSLWEGNRTKTQATPSTGHVKPLEDDGQSFEDLLRELHG